MIRLVLEAVDANLSAVISRLHEVLGIGCSPRVKMHLELALEEAFVNVAHYAYDGKPGKIEVDFDKQDDMLKVTLSDSGKPYDPLKKPDPDITLSAEKRQIGGLGIYLIKKYTDGISYEYRDGKNHLTIVKKLR